jgi:hypothetical protein
VDALPERADRVGAEHGVGRGVNDVDPLGSAVEVVQGAAAPLTTTCADDDRTRLEAFWSAGIP